MSKNKLSVVVAALVMVVGGSLVMLNGWGEEPAGPVSAPEAPAPVVTEPVEPPAPPVPVVAPPEEKPPKAVTVANIVPPAEEPVVVAPPEEESGPFLDVNPAAGGSISGTVKLDGRAPRKRKINSQMRADPKCAALHPKSVYSDIVVVDKKTKAVKWAFVYVKTGLEGKKFKAPKTPAKIVQKACMYDPHVFGVMVGQEMLIVNEDDVVHNIHALPFENREFNFAQPQKGMEEKKTFTKKEIMVKFKCDVHPWMGAWVGVLEHPFHATTAADGTFKIKGLPAGKYTVEVWHEIYKSLTADVTVVDGKEAKADFTLKDKKE